MYFLSNFENYRNKHSFSPSLKQWVVFKVETNWHQWFNGNLDILEKRTNELKLCTFMSPLLDLHFKNSITYLTVELTLSLEPMLNLQLRWLLLNVSAMFSWLITRTPMFLLSPIQIGWKGGAWTWVIWSFHDHFRRRPPYASNSIPPYWSIYNLQDRQIFCFSWLK